MIEANNPEINVDELMQKIRDEVANRRVLHQDGMTYQPQASNLMPGFEAIFNHIQVYLKNAEFRAYLRTKWPDNLNKFPFNFIPQLQKIILKILNLIFKDQREVNFNLINALKESVAINQQLVEQITTLKTQMDERLGAVNSCVQSLDERVAVVESCVQNLDERMAAVENRVQNLDERVAVVENRVADSCHTIDTLISDRLNNSQESLNAVNCLVQETDKYLGAVDTRTQKLDERLSNVDTRLLELQERYVRNDSYLKNDLMQQKRLITLFLEEVRQRSPEAFNQQQLQTFISEEQHSLDAFYVAFEDEFRGTREDILNKLKVYLPFIEQAQVGTPDSPILDVGCGRGEWLELLRESGYTARGIDINRVMLEQCRARKLEVIESDVIAYLQSLPDASLGVVTGFHIIEHLPFEKLIKLFDETVRVIKPGGFAIYETPNPQNIQVGSNLFYIDPTHRNPLPSLTVKFLAQVRGLCNVKVINLNPYPNEMRLVGSEVAEQFSNYFYGPQDYAIIGYKL